MNNKVNQQDNKHRKTQSLHSQNIEKIWSSSAILQLDKYAEEILISMGVPGTVYSFGEYSENAFCMVKWGSTWQVYLGERNMKFDLASFNSYEEAFGNLCYRIFDKQSDINKSITSLNRIITKYGFRDGDLSKGII